MTVENDVNGATKVLAADSLASSQGDTANGTSHTGQVYEVGLAGSAFQELSDIDWNDLRPGDVVRIHWREEAYNERILLNAQGTEENPIVIEGVPGPNGELPVLDADGATTDDQFSNYGEVFRQNLGGSFFIGTPSSFPSDDEIPQNITIRGLEITGAGQGNTFTGTDGVEHDREFTAGIYVKGGVNITIEDNYIHHNGNGVFSSSQHEFEITENLVIRGNTFENNGVEGRFTDHHTYTEGLNTLIEHNTFGPKLNGDFGSLVKSRDVGLTIRNNEFGSAPGHFIDIGNIEADALIAGGYHQTDAYLHGSFVYENNIVASTGSIFFGGDTFGKDRGTGLGYDYRQTLEFHDNNVTYIADREDAYRVEILRAPNIEQTFNLSGNTFETLTETPGAAVPFFGLISSNGDPSVNFTGTNYFSPTLSLFNDRGPGDGIITGFDENVEFLEVDEREVETPVDQDPTDGGEAPSAGDEGEGDGDGIVRTGTDASDVFTATSGDDTLEGLGGNDFLYGYEGDDLIVGGDGDDLIAGNEGNDILIGGRGNDQLFGDSGADIFVFTSESYGNGSDTIKAFSVEDGDRLDFSELLQAFNPETDDLSDFIRISVEDLYHTVIAVDVDGGGDGFVDVVTLSYNTDYDLKALVESQALVLPTNVDTGPTETQDGDGDGIVITGTDASDVFTATSGDDTLEGLGGNDFLYGYGGDDLIVGGDGDDLIAGNEGNDTLIGGRGNDQLFGDSGADTFAFTTESYGNGSDTIKAFSVEDGDRLDFRELLQSFNSETDHLSDFIRVSVEDLYHTVIAVNLDGGSYGFVDVVTLAYNTDYDLNTLVESQALILPTNVDTGPTETQDGDGIVRTGTDASDVFTATSGEDILEGLGGSDFLYGYGGDDLIVGGDGDDLIAGNEGNDTLIGGRGNDQLFGDSGADTFAFTAESYGNGSDTIKAFSVEDGDRLDFRELLQSFNSETDHLSDFIRVSVEDLYHTVIAVNLDGGSDGFVDVVTLAYNTDYDLNTLVESQALILPTNVDTGPSETFVFLSRAEVNVAADYVADTVFLQLEQSPRDGNLPQQGVVEAYASLGTDVALDFASSNPSTQLGLNTPAGWDDSLQFV